MLLSQHPLNTTEKVKKQGENKRKKKDRETFISVFEEDRKAIICIAEL